jgi:RHS repeat-associated protein
VNTYTYDAYDQPLTTSETVANPFRYTGEYLDEESGFIYLRARYYDPESQQFLTVDPMLAWTEEAYAYAGGDPANSTDPTGLCRTADGADSRPASECFPKKYHGFYWFEDGRYSTSKRTSDAAYLTGCSIAEQYAGLCPVVDYSVTGQGLALASGVTQAVGRTMGAGGA